MKRHFDATTSKLKRSNVASISDSKLKSQCCECIMLYWQHGWNVEIKTSNSQLLQNFDRITSNLQRFPNVVSMLDGKFTLQYIMDVVIATSNWQLLLVINIVQGCTKVVSDLRRTSNETILCGMVTFPQTWVKVLTKIAN